MSKKDSYEESKQNTELYMKSKKILKKFFGYDNFKPYQYMIIDNIVSCTDVVAIMPTGYGKSLCFQIIPLLTAELGIVISPLIALMVDQKRILDNLGISCCCYNSDVSAKDKRIMEGDLLAGKYQILYITPESLTNSHKLIDKIYEKVGICMIAIDEAHCLSSYGFDFRPKYREIAKIRDILHNVPVLAITATATNKVVKDISSLMNINDNGIFIKTSFDRPNLTIHVKLQSSNTINEIIRIINNTDGSAIVYCVTKDNTEKIANELTKGGIMAKAYHAGLSKNQRSEIQEQFMDGEYKCITATIAFGMGINKSDIRTVIHYGCSQNIESYYQEIGRAGRDGKESNCYLFYRQRDFEVQKLLINKSDNVNYKNVRTNLLHEISKYVSTNVCRRKTILNYFGENYNGNCNKCDNCMIKNKNDNKCISYNDEFKLFQVLSTVLAVTDSNNHSYGVNMFALILKGSSNKNVKKWMKSLTYYGCMKPLTISQINTFIHKIIELGYIESYDAGECVHVLRCTDRGIGFGQKYEKYLHKSKYATI